MPLITPQPKATEKEQLTVRLEKPTHELLKRYCEFIQSTQDYVLNQALMFTFKQDKTIDEWLTVNPTASGDVRTTRGRLRKHERTTPAAK